MSTTFYKENNRAKQLYKPVAKEIIKYYNGLFARTYKESTTEEDKLGVDFWLFNNKNNMFQAFDLKAIGANKQDNEYIPIELISNDKKGTPGWTTDANKITDYVVYHYEQSGGIYLISFTKLHNYIMNNLEELENTSFNWETQYNCNNNLYSTKGILLKRERVKEWFVTIRKGKQLKNANNQTTATRY